MKLTPEILISSLWSMPFLALTVVFFTVAVMCIVMILLTVFSGAFQEKQGEARNRKPVLKVLVVSTVVLLIFGFLSILGFSQALTEAAELVANTEDTN